MNRPEDLQGKMYFWNFLPPDELENLLKLKKRLDGKILRINATLGIEGAIISPDDPEMSLKEFNKDYDKVQTTEELMNLEGQKLASAHPELWQKLDKLPRRVFSGRAVADGFEPIIDREGNKVERIQPFMKPGLFFCYRMPPVIGKAPRDMFENKREKLDPKKHLPGEVRWYYYDAESDEVHEELDMTWAAVRCVKDTERQVKKGVKKLTDIRKKVEKHIRNTYLRDVQAPLGSKAVLVGWVEVNKFAS